MKNFLIQLLGFIFLLMIYVAGNATENIDPWQQMTQNDLRLVHDTIKQNTPLFINGKPTQFAAWLEPGYQQALKRAQTVRTFSGYIYTLRFYANGFHDYHTMIVPLLRIMNPTEQWPGFIAALRDDHYEVVFNSKQQNIWLSLPPVGAHLIACDGKTPTQLMQENILPYYRADVRYPGTWQEASPYLFVWDNNPWAVKPTICQFSYGNAISSYHLNWFATYNNTPLANLNPDRVDELIQNAAYGPSPEFGIRALSADSVWVSIPIFSWGLAAQGANTTQLLNNIAKQMPSLRNKRLIVFDVRGNSGGDPAYMWPILINLYGENYLRSLGKKFPLNNSEVIQFHVSEKNLQHMIASKSPAKMIAQMQRALANKVIDMYYQDEVFDKDRKISAAINPVRAKIIVLTDGRCASECTSFVSDLLALPNTVQVGQPTANVAASTWNDVQVFPDQASALLYPTGVKLGNSDAFNKPLFPRYTYHGYMGDTKKLQEWILGLNF